MVANLVLSRGGLKASDVSYIGVGVAAGALTALRSGQIDAISNTDPVMTMLEQKGDVKIISDTRTLKGTQDVFGGPMPAACLYAPTEFVQKNPNTCQALANAIVHGLKWLQTAGPGRHHQDRARDLPAGRPRAVPRVVRQGARGHRHRRPDAGRGAQDRARRRIASFDPTVKADKIDLAKTYTNDFARRAKDRFKA